MRVRKLISCLLVCFLLTTYLPDFVVLAEEKKPVAVYELTGKETNEDMLVRLSDALKSAIPQSGVYGTRIISKEERRLVAERENIDLGCNSDACLAKIANSLGIENMITGSVDNFGGVYVISLRLIDTKTVQTINTASLSCACEENDLIEKIKEMGIQLLTAKKPAQSEEKTFVEPPDKEVNVTSEPSTPVPQEKHAGYSYSKWFWWTGGILIVAGGAAFAILSNQKQATPPKKDDSPTVVELRW